MPLGFRDFTAATKAETPPIAAATVNEAKLRNEANARVNALQSQNILGGASLYNMGMGDKSPIADFISDGWASMNTPAEFAPTVSPTNTGVNQSLQAPMSPAGGDPFTQGSVAPQGAEFFDPSVSALPDGAITPDMLAADGVGVTAPVDTAVTATAGTPTAPTAAAGAGPLAYIGGPAAALGGYAQLQSELGESEGDIATSMVMPIADAATLGLSREGGGPIGELFDDGQLEEWSNYIGDALGGLFG